MNIKLGFDPENISENTEASVAFEAGGIALKFWLLYKRNHITNQYFKPVIERLAQLIDEAYDHESDRELYQTPMEFKQLLNEAGFAKCSISGFYSISDDWIMEHWDYLNPNIKRTITLEYDKQEVVTKTIHV